MQLHATINYKKTALYNIPNTEGKDYYYYVENLSDFGKNQGCRAVRFFPQKPTRTSQVPTEPTRTSDFQTEPPEPQTLKPNRNLRKQLLKKRPNPPKDPTHQSAFKSRFFLFITRYQNVFDV